MLTDRFETLFGDLTGSFIAYDDVPRTADTVAALGRARWALEGVRRSIAAERELIVSRHEQIRDTSRTTLSSSDIAIINIQGMIGN